MDDNIIIEMGLSDIHATKLEDVTAAVNEMVELIKSKEPRIIFYNAYVNEGGTQLTVLHAHPDSASLEFHTEVIGPFLAKRRNSSLRQRSTSTASQVRVCSISDNLTNS